MKMNEKEFQAYLHKNIPVTKAMDFKVLEFNSSRVRIQGDYKTNINHRSTAFGGSISSLLIMAGWSVVRYIMEDVDPSAHIVIKSSTVDFMKPIIEDFTAEAVFPSKEDLQSFIQRFRERKRAKLPLVTEIRLGTELAAKLTGEFVVLGK